MSARRVRSPAYRGSQVVKFEPIDPHGKTDRELLVDAVLGVNAVHHCVHMVNTKVEGLRDDLQTVAGEVGKIKTTQDIDGGRIAGLAKRMGSEKPDPGEKVKVAIAGQPAWKVGITVLGGLSGAVLAFQLAAPVISAGAVALYRAVMAA